MQKLSECLEWEVEEIVRRGGSPTIIFDYDGTIATIPINWLDARLQIRVFLESKPVSLTFADGLRVDEMEAIAIDKRPELTEYIFSFRSKLEKEQIGSHVPVKASLDFLQSKLVQDGKVRLYIISNNLKNTVESGLRTFGLLNWFEAVIGIDTTNQPKPMLASALLLHKNYGIKFRDSIMVGDNESTDGEFCRAAGVKFLNIKNYK